MVNRIFVGGLGLIVIGFVIVIVHALNMGKLSGVDSLLPELGLVLIGIAVQLLGLGIVLIGKK